MGRKRQRFNRICMPFESKEAITSSDLPRVNYAGLATTDNHGAIR